MISAFLFSEKGPHLSKHYVIENEHIT